MVPHLMALQPSASLATLVHALANHCPATLKHWYRRRYQDIPKRKGTDIEQFDGKYSLIETMEQYPVQLPAARE